MTPDCGITVDNNLITHMYAPGGIISNREASTQYTLHSVFIAWTEWTLAMALPWWQHYKYLRAYYYYHYYYYYTFNELDISVQTEWKKNRI